MKRFSNLMAVGVLSFAALLGIGLISIEFYHHMTIVGHPFETKRWAWGCGLALFSAAALQMGSIKAAAEEAKLVLPVIFTRAGRRDSDPVVATPPIAPAPAPAPIPTKAPPPIAPSSAAKTSAEAEEE